MREDSTSDTPIDRDRAAARRDVDAGVRDLLAADDMPDPERDARMAAARDRMAAMNDRQAAARDRAEAEAEAEAEARAEDERRRSQRATDDA